ncbi:MAG: hypothetical protein AMJ45_04720 [Syntrophobacter sp. DG_60]|nr:MAG: hypothetical protein AMJ45_04720 [Syntrophobacter sp. DG_60]
MNWKWVIILILLLLLVIFAAQNYEVVKIQFLFWSLKTSRAVVVFSALFIGIVIGWISFLLKR